MPPRSAGPLRGVRVIVAGAGLSGLVAARALARRGASVRVFEPRARTGGRVWTVRDPPFAPHHVELGGELIDREHGAIRGLARELKVDLVRVLRRGFGAALEQGGRVRVFPEQTPLWKKLAKALGPAARAFDAADRDWGSTAAAAIAGRSFRDALGPSADAAVHALATALRGMLLADPEDLSALVAVEQTLAGEDPSRLVMYRVKRGADRLLDALVRDARCPIHLGHAVRAVRQDARAVTVTIDGPEAKRAEARADYLVVTAPPAVIREWEFAPALPGLQRQSFEAIGLGRATKAVLRYETRWWRQAGRPRAFSSNLPIGAIWEQAEEQKKAACLTLLAGGAASAELNAILATEGTAGIARRLRWLGARTRPEPAVISVSWEADPWARGGYGYFGPAFDPALRPLLGRAAGRVLFAGDHTSRDYQGYMNGAVESGLRAAREISTLERLRA